MRIDEAISLLKQYIDYNNPDVPDFYTMEEACKVVIKALEQEPCDDCVSRQVVIDAIDDDNRNEYYSCFATNNDAECFKQIIRDLPPVTPMPKMGHCKDCKYFEYDSLAKVDGIKLIVAHEICKRWGDGCKSKEDGYCFLFEPRAEGSEE